MSTAGGNAGFLSDQQVDLIATRLAERLSAPGSVRSQTNAAKSTATTNARGFADECSGFTEATTGLSAGKKVAANHGQGRAKSWATGGPAG